MSKSEPEKKTRRKPKFGRVLIPPEKFHTTKKGAKGYSRDQQKRLVREARSQREEPSA